MILYPFSDNAIKPIHHLKLQELLFTGNCKQLLGHDIQDKREGDSNNNFRDDIVVARSNANNCTFSHNKTECRKISVNHEHLIPDLLA